MTRLNRFNLNINNPRNMQAMQRMNHSSVNNGSDLRNTYSVSARFNEFNNFLRSNGMTYEQFSYMQWEANKASVEQNMLANNNASKTILSSFQSIVDGVKSIFKI